MKYSRLKKLNRTMNFFRNHYGFRIPYQILIDGTFCVTAKKNGIKITVHLSKYFNCEVKILTTQCAILEAEIFGRDLRGGLEVLKQFPHHKCGHEGKPVTAFECFESMLGAKNENRYIIATNDTALQKVANTIPGVPILFLRDKVPILHRVSKTSERMANLRGRESLKVNDAQKEALIMFSKNHLGVEEEEEEEEEVVQPKKKLKRKKRRRYRMESSEIGSYSETPAPPTDNAEPKRKRKRIKIPQHVKEHFREMLNNKEVCT